MDKVILLCCLISGLSIGFAEAQGSSRGGGVRCEGRLTLNSSERAREQRAYVSIVLGGDQSVRVELEPIYGPSERFRARVLREYPDDGALLDEESLYDQSFKIITIHSKEYNGNRFITIRKKDDRAGESNYHVLYSYHSYDGPDGSVTTGRGECRCN